MNLIDKAMNRVIKWESIDVTIPEMVDLVQTEILEKASAKDLAELEKGMQKTFVLAVGGGSSLRYYPSFTSQARLCLDFNPLTHQLQGISLQDTENKKEYFIPTGKASCTRLQSGVLRRMAQAGYSVGAAGKKSGSNDKYPNKNTSRNHPVNGRDSSLPLRKENTGKVFRQEESLPYENGRRASRSGGRGGKYAQKRRSPVVPILRIVGIIALCAVVAFGVLALVDHFGEPSTEENVATVQSGYLGEYTDVTVKEIFDICYGSFYEKSLWDGGKTDDGKILVQAKYYDENDSSDPTIIQFTMLNKECFKISAFVDPDCTFSEATELLGLLNFEYAVAYAYKNDRNFEENDVVDLIERMSNTSGSAVKYGASVDYTGNRASICTLDGEDPLKVSAAMVLDHYEIWDLQSYFESHYPSVKDTQPTGYFDDNTEDDFQRTQASQDSDPEKKEDAALSMNNAEHLPYQYTVDYLHWELSDNVLRAKTTYLNQNLEICGRLQYADTEYFLLGPTEESYDNTTIRCLYTSEDQKNYIAQRYTGQATILQGHVISVDNDDGYIIEVMEFGSYPENTYIEVPDAVERLWANTNEYTDRYTGTYGYMAHDFGEGKFWVGAFSDENGIHYLLTFELGSIWQYNEETATAYETIAYSYLKSTDIDIGNKGNVIHFSSENISQSYPGTVDLWVSNGGDVECYADINIPGVVKEEALAQNISLINNSFE